MSAHARDDLEKMGYFLPEDSQLLLTRLRDHMQFLARLVQPRTADEAMEAVPEVRMGELTFCLELLAEQAGRVLDEATWTAGRPRVASAADASGDVMDGDGVSMPAAGGTAFGVTLDQVDALGRLVDAIAAHGDVLAAGGAEHFEDRTLPVLGQAIHDAANALRTLLEEVEAQPLAHGSRMDAGVREPGAIYGVCLPSPAAGSARLH